MTRVTPDDILDMLEYAELELGRDFISVADRKEAAKRVGDMVRRLKVQLRRIPEDDQHAEEVSNDFGVAARDPDFDEFRPFDEEAA